jgi:multiple sugar transport system permease protein
MSAPRFSMPQHIVLYGVLVGGAMAFGFPFFWMVASSVKGGREIAAENHRLLPRRPVPRHRSPYVDETTFDAPRHPDDVPLAVWQQAKPRLIDLAAERLASWTPRTVDDEQPIDAGTLDAEAWKREMTEGLFDALWRRLSDTARRHAVQADEPAGAENDARDALPENREAPVAAADPDRPLSEGAIDAGTEAILADARSIISDELMRETFDRVYRRLCLGPCRARTTDRKQVTIATGGGWKLESGSGRLVERRRSKTIFQEAHLDLSSDGSAAFILLPEAAAASAEVDRLFVAYRADESWSRIAFEVIRAGKRYRTAQVLNLHDRKWVEAQLRWPDDLGDPMKRRPYLVLHPAGDAPAGSPNLSIRIEVRANSTIGAWWDKLLTNYRIVFRELPFGRYFMTSLSLSLLNVVLMVLSCTLAAYAFARLSWPGRDLWFGIMLATMMIPTQVTMIPSFLIHRHLGWYNTLLPLWVHAAFGSAFFIFLMRQFLRTVPNDLEEAARIDGCGFLRIYWHVMMPLVVPTIATIAIFTFTGTWNNFMGPLIYLNDERLFPLALGLFKFNLRSGGEMNLMMAASFIMTLPIIVLFVVLQKAFLEGVTTTGMKT